MKNAGATNRDTYVSISAATEGLFKDKGSRFIAYAYPISSEDEVKVLVDALKREHHAARHHCFAYRTGPEGAVWRASDDGEPSGTAGRQILGAIDSCGLSDVLVVVVRYFGGILLGVPGLIRAYREASADALAKAVRKEKVAERLMELEFDYTCMNDVQKFLKSSGARVVESSYDMRCMVRVAVRLSEVEDFTYKLKKINDEKSTCVQCRSL